MQTMRLHVLLIGLGTEELGGELHPSHRLSTLGERRVGSIVHQTHLLPGSNNLAESTVSHGTSDQVLTVLEAVELLEDRRVSVGVTNEIVSRREVVWLGGSPKLKSASNLSHWLGW